VRQGLTLISFLFCVSCVSSNTSQPQAALPPCAPGDTSWGCRSLATGQPATAATPGAQPQVAQPTAWSPPAATVPAVAATSPAPAATIPAQVVGDDAINRADIQFQRSRVTAVAAELIGALDGSTRARVERLPITFDPNANDINAFATCTKSGKATIAITDGMLVLTAYLAQLQASDEVLATRYFDQYVVYVAQNQRQNAPVPAPPAAWLPSATRNHPTKVARQQQLNDEMLAFVLGHELAHHYLNHLPCTSILPLDAAEIGILLTDAVPGFNQPNETAADVAGIRNVLAAGRKRSTNQLTETGALLQMRFFRALDQASPADIFNFERSHPPPSIREPIIQTSAQAFRAGAGITWPWQM
jgi:hypothetical protein